MANEMENKITFEGEFFSKKDRSKIDKLYLNDLKQSRKALKFFTKSNDMHCDVIGLAQFKLEQYTAEGVAQVQAKIKRFFRALLWEEMTDSDVSQVNFFLIPVKRHEL